MNRLVKRYLVQPRATRLFKRYLIRPEASAVVILALMMIVFQLYSGHFLTPANIKIMLGIIPELGLVALGATLLMIGGEFDLSVGSVFAFTPMAMAVLADRGLNVWLSIVVSLIAAAVFGYVNGVITLRFKIPSFVTTLGMLFVVRSLTVVISGGFPPEFPANAPTWLFSAEYGFIRISLIWYLAACLAAYAVLNHTNFGNWIYATGGDPEAATNMGINIYSVKLTTFVITALLAGLAGILQVMRLHSALPSLGTGLELQAIAAAVIGGTALTGGIGSVLGAVVGATLIRVIDDGLVVSLVNANWFNFAVGGLTILAVIFNTRLRLTARGMRVEE